MSKNSQRIILLQFMRSQIEINELLKEAIKDVSNSDLFDYYKQLECNSLIDLQETNLRALRDIMERDAFAHGDTTQDSPPQAGRGP